MKSLDDYFATTPATTKDLLMQVYAWIGKVDAQLKPQVKWGTPWYVIQKPIVYVTGHARHINVGFARGTDLLPAFSNLEGSGKNMRHVKITNLNDLATHRVEQMIKEAIRIDSQTKITLK